MSIGARLIVVALLVSVPAAAQQKKWRTPWGDPDLQGSWTNANTTPLQRPAKYAGREFLTPEERAEQDRRTDIGTDQRGATPERDVQDAYNRFWWDRGYSDGRTSLIIDPPDGRIPPLTPEGQKRADTGRWRTAYEHVKFMDTLRADGPEDRNDPERCRALQLPCINFLCQLTRIVQASDSVSIYYEGHDGG